MKKILLIAGAVLLTLVLIALAVLGWHFPGT